MKLYAEVDDKNRKLKTLYGIVEYMDGTRLVCDKFYAVKEQEPKTGHWFDDNENELDAQYGRHLYKCSECDKYANAFVGGTEDWWDIEKPKYCPQCGARMESEES